MVTGEPAAGTAIAERVRHYNDETKKFVAEHTKGGAQDKRDAKVLSDMEKKHQR